ncbi:MAG: calcium-binding protein [Methylococcales bacterium]|nr:calcium-binding protein [Methylococcales bacterium]
MSQTNSNNTSVSPTNVLTDTFGNINADDHIVTILGSANATGLDGVTANGDYTTAQALEARTANTANIIASNVASFDFLPTEAVAKTEWAAATKGGYLDATAWTATPKLTGNASSFVLSNAGDNGKTATFSETINGSPFATGNGSVSEALTFVGATNDTLAVKHTVSVANVPSTTNNNADSALDVRNESYAENYAKAGVTSNYVQTNAHKYVEVNGNQSLNNAFAETYAYKDAGLTINSAVKTTLANTDYINGSERLAESKSANYHYASATGSVDYVVTDTRNLAQADQRTWTNTTVTNVAKFEVKDLVNKTTVTASGLVTSTTTNLAATQFAPTNSKFNVSSDHYNLDVKNFATGDAANTNALLSLLDSTSSTGDVFNSALGNGVVPTAFNKYVSVATDTLTGTQFADTITVKDVAGAVAGTFVGGNVNAGAGNDTITGSKGDDVLTGGTGADTFIVTAGNDTVTDFALGSDALTVTKGTGTAKVTVKFADGTSADYNVTANATTDVIIPAAAKTKADLEAIGGVAPDTINWVDTAGVDDNKVGSAGNDTLDGAGGSDTLNGAAGNDILIGGKSADQLTGGAGSDTFVYKNTNESSVKFKSVDTITDFQSGTDKIDLSAIDADATATGDQAFAFTTAAFTNAAEVKLNGSVLEGHTAGHTTVDFTINLTGVTSVAATDFVL